MIEPKRLLEAEGTDIELRLLGAARNEAPSKALEARMRAGLGLPFVAPGPVSDFPPAVPAPTATTTSGAAGQGAAQAASQAATAALAGQIAASQLVAGQAASGAAAMGAASGAGTGLSWAKVLVGVALLGGFGAAAFSVASGDERSAAKSGVVTARAPGEPGAPAAASPPPGATPSSTPLPSTRPSTIFPSTASNPSTTTGSDAATTTGSNALVDGSPSNGAHATVDGTTTAGVTSSANAPSGAARGATASAGSTATGSSVARSSAASAAGSSVASTAGATAPRATTLAAGAPSSAPSRETALNEEIRLVDSMRSALAQGDGSLALSRAATYRSRFPAGTLREEVEALRIEATRLSGDPKRADALADRFASEHPTSPHLGRVRGATSGTSTSPKR